MPLLGKKKSSDNLEEFRDIKDDVIESDFVPYACHWDENTLITKNGELLQTIKISDIHTRHPDSDERDLRTHIRQALQGAITSTDYAVWVHTVRRKISFQSGGEFKRDFAGYLDRFWRDRNDWEHKFVNEVYITIVREGEAAPLFGPLNFVRQIIPRIDIRHREKKLDEGVLALNGVTDSIVEALSDFGATKLGIYKQNDTWYSQPCSFLGKLTTLQDDELPLEQVSIAEYITDYDVTFGFNAMEVRMRSDGRRRFGAYLSIKEYRELPIESLETVLKMPTEFVISQCYMFTDSQNALKGFEYQQKLFDMSGASVLAQRSGLNEILEADQGNPTDFCEYQLGIFVLAESVRSLDSNVFRAVSTLNSLGMVAIREDIMLEECYWSILPANFQMIKRLKPLNSSAMAGLVHLNNLPVGKVRNNHWGPAVTTFHTINRTPYFFNFHVGSNGHTALVSPPDTGKKIILNFLVAQARKFDGKLFYFDRNRLAEPFVRSIDGAYYNPCNGADSRQYVALKLNPLQMEDTPDNRMFLERWLKLLMASADDSDGAACAAAIAAVMAKPREQRNLAACAAALDAHTAGLGGKLASWLPGGAQGAMFSEGEDTLNLDGKVYGFEMQDLFTHKPALEPITLYLLHRVMQALDGKPAMIVLDEAWDLLSLPSLSSDLKNWFAALEARNAMALLATEHVDDIKDNPLNRVIFPAVATKIFLPDDSADSSYADIFGVAEKDIAFLPVMDPDERHFMVVQNKEMVVLEMDLSGMVDIVSVLQASPYHLQMMEQAIHARGISPSQWMPKFLESI